jgi:osmotically-inducible protein OsmY
VRRFDPVRGASLLLMLAAASGCQTVDMAQLLLQERQYAEDRLLAAEITGEFAADPILADAGIDIDVYLKQVTLRGHADHEQARRALIVAEAVPLVANVTDALQIVASGQ